MMKNLSLLRFMPIAFLHLNNSYLLQSNNNKIVKIKYYFNTMSNINQKNCMIQVKNVNIPIQIQPGYVPVKAV